MFVQSHSIVFGRPLAEDLLDALSARPAAALLVTPFVHLFTAGPAPITPFSLPADFTEATFVGYAAAAWTLPLLGAINVDSVTLGVHNEENFLAGAVVAPGEMILGYWVDEAAAGGVIMYLAELFAAPIPIEVAGDFISLDIIAALRTALDF
jgi:hypothetical protein